MFKFRNNRPVLTNKHITLENCPTEILLKIFSFLNFKELCNCALVNKRWWEIASTDDIWLKLFKRYGINKPLSKNITAKEEYFKRSHTYLKQVIKKQINQVQKFDKFKEIGLTCQLSFLNKYHEKLAVLSSKIAATTQFVTMKPKNYAKFPLTMDPSKINEVDYLSIDILIPMIVKQLVPRQEAPLITMKMYQIHIDKAKWQNLFSSNNKCKCSQIQPNFQPNANLSLIEWHNCCVSRFLIGIWKKDRSLAYLSCVMPLMECKCFIERNILRSQQFFSFNSICTCKECKSNMRISNISGTFSIVSCVLRIYKIHSGEEIFSRYWASTDYYEGSPMELIRKERDSYGFEFRGNLEFNPVIDDIRQKYKNIILIDVQVMNSSYCLWSYSGFVMLESHKISEVYMESEYESFRYQDDLISVTMLKEFEDDQLAYKISELTLF